MLPDHGPVRSHAGRNVDPAIYDAIERGDAAYHAGRVASANAAFRRAAGLLQPSVLTANQDAGFVLNDTLDLSAYFVYTHDAGHARLMWRRFEDAATRIYAPLGSQTASSRIVADDLAAGNAKHAFATMFAGDKAAVEDDFYWRRETGQPDIVVSALRMGSRGDFIGARDELRRAIGTCDNPALSYPYYALGVAYEALHDHQRALNSWIYATLFYDDPPSVDIPEAPRAAYRAATALSRLY